MKQYAVIAPISAQDEPDYFETYEEAEKCAEEYIESFLDGDSGWSDDVNFI